MKTIFYRILCAKFHVEIILNDFWSNISMSLQGPYDLMVQLREIYPKVLHKTFNFEINDSMKFKKESSIDNQFLTTCIIFHKPISHTNQHIRNEHIKFDTK